MNNVFSLNECDEDGGGNAIACFLSPAAPVISHNVIKDNKKTAAIVCVLGCTPTITHNRIFGNDSSGIAIGEAEAVIENNVIRDNTGLGIYLESTFSTSVANNMISGNNTSYEAIYGGGIMCNLSVANLNNNTIVNNVAHRGGGLCVYDSVVTMANTILWGNDATEGPEIYIGSLVGTGSLDISYSDVEGGEALAAVDPGDVLNWGMGMIDADPLFICPQRSNLHLSASSPCKNAGDNLAPGLPATDFEGDPRIHRKKVDMGADEYYSDLPMMPYGSSRVGASF